MDEGGADVDVLLISAVTVLMLDSSAPVTVTMVVTKATRPVQDNAQENVESHRAARHDDHGCAVYLEITVVYPLDCEIHQDSSDVPIDNTFIYDVVRLK